MAGNAKFLVSVSSSSLSAASSSEVSVGLGHSISAYKWRRKITMGLLCLTIGGVFQLSPLAALADDYVLTMQNHKFAPQDLVVPAHQKLKITVKNLDADKAEFESSDLDREQVVDAKGGEIAVFIGPLDPGTYDYFNDYDHSMIGTITAK